MNEEKKRPEQETKAPAQIDITPGSRRPRQQRNRSRQKKARRRKHRGRKRREQTAPVLCSPLIVHKEGDASTSRTQWRTE